MEWISRDDAAKRLDIDGDKLKALCKEHLVWRKDYRVHRNDGIQICQQGFDKIEAVLSPQANIYRERKGDEVLKARVGWHLPPNPRRMWVMIDGEDVQHACNVPPKFARMYRVPGKSVYVRHVEDDVYQLVIPDWRNENS